MYDQVQGDNMKNKLLFMMFTMLGVPGIAAATTSYDLANSEYNFAVNELSKSSFNQAAIIGQVGTANSANTRQGARSYCQSFRKKVLVIERKQTRRDHITLHILIKRVVPMMRVLNKVHTVIRR